jgi:hypothetical protein
MSFVAPETGPATMEQAKGALMLAYGVDSAEALAMLVDVSERSRTGVDVIARRLVAQLPALQLNPRDRKGIDGLLVLVATPPVEDRIRPS